MKKIFTCILIAFFLSGCSPSFKLSPMLDTNETQQMFYLDGNEIAVSEKRNTTIAIMGEKHASGEIEITLLISNISTESINIYPNNIKVYGIDSFDVKEEFEVIEPEEYLQNLQNSQKVNLITQAFYGFVETRNSDKSSTSITGRVGGLPFNATAETSDKSKQVKANRQLVQDINSLKEINDRNYDTIKQSLLKKHTIFPEEQVVGAVMVKFKPAIKYILEIPLGNDIHIIEFEPNPQFLSKISFKANNYDGFYTKIKWRK